MTIRRWSAPAGPAPLAPFTAVFGVISVACASSCVSIGLPASMSLDFTLQYPLRARTFMPERSTFTLSLFVVRNVLLMVNWVSSTVAVLPLTDWVLVEMVLIAGAGVP